MKIRHGASTTKYGPGIEIILSGEEIATAIHAYTLSHGIHISGPMTVSVNGDLCEYGRVYVDPSGKVINHKSGQIFEGRG